MSIKTPVTEKRLKKMCKYFKGKKVFIEYVYNDSLGNNSSHCYEGKYDNYEVRGSLLNGYVCIRFLNKTKIVFEFDMYISCASFVGLGKIEIVNNGPYCYFEIKYG